MIKQKFTLLLVSALLYLNAFAQTGEIKGRIIDKANGQPIPYANIVAEAHGHIVSGSATDFDGYYTIKPLQPGSYDVRATYVGYNTFLTTNVSVSPDKITFISVKLETSALEIPEVQIIIYRDPLIDKNPGAITTLGHDDIANMPGRTAQSVAQTVPGVYSKDDGSGNMNIRGTRNEASNIYIDGVKVRGSSSVPASAIDQVSVYTGGLPPQYGDATGGIMSITTRGPSKEFSGGVEYLTSGFYMKRKNKNYTDGSVFVPQYLVSEQRKIGLDPYGYNLLGFNISGPLVQTRNEFDTTRMEPLLGFFLAGELISQYDPEPTATGIWTVNDSMLAYLKEKPLGYDADNNVINHNALYLRDTDLINLKARPNSQSRGINLNAKIDVRTGQNINLAFGGNIDFNNSKDRNRDNYLANYEHQGQSIGKTLRGWVRFSQKFATDTSRKASVIKNAFYTVQFDYQKYYETTQDPIHKKNFFDYGYVGEFKTYSERSYTDAIDGKTQLKGWTHNGFVDTLITFNPGTQNPLMAQYTKQSYDLYKDITGLDYRNSDEVQNGKGLLNGDAPADLYGLWGNIRDRYNGYTHRNNGQFRLSASGSADIGNHAFSAGFEYEQREDRLFRVRPGGLWDYLRLNVNSHIDQLDKDHPYAVYYTGSGQRVVISDWNTIMNIKNNPGDTIFADTIYYDRFFNAQVQTLMDFNLRQNQKLSTNGLDWIDVNALPPDQLSLNLFSPDELLANGTGAGSSSSFVDYFGYDAYGKKLKKDPSFDDFFNKKYVVAGYEGPELYERSIGPYRPIYLAGYIQDKFAFKDLIFNVGLRVDRFDANQYVLKDPYLLFPAVTAGEIREGKDRSGLDIDIPENIGNNYVVYVDNIQKPTTIVGYRNNDTWYNSFGTEINDPDALSTSGGIQPYLVDQARTTGTDVGIDAFKDYEPQVTYMPRVAFSFPISDEALFFAHYDVLSQRPSSPYSDPIERLDPTDYFFINNRNITLNNPALKPDRTVDYELGFQQKLAATSSLKLSAFYRELRDQIQISSYVGAYPKKYKTFKNIDFGTVKGFNIAYDLRRLGNARVRANYALQFAEGTGSSIDQANNLINAGQPNLKIISPFGYDQRHAFNLSVDWRYTKGAEYNGPVLFNKQILSDAGANLLFVAGSGTPYSRYISAVKLGDNGNLVGSINGARLPWQFRMDARVDKDFELKFGGKAKTDSLGNEIAPAKTAKSFALNVYFQILNVLNTKNIVSVYGFTGNADDDGYLSSAANQSAIGQQIDEQSYRDLYAVKMNNYDNYALPRRLRLGLVLNF